MSKKLTKRQASWRKLERVKTISEKEQILTELFKNHNFFKNHQKNRQIYNRLLSRGFKNFHSKPILVMYLTHSIIADAQRKGKDVTFFEHINQKLKDEYILFVLPIETDKEMRIEVWGNGIMLKKVSAPILQQVVYPFQNKSYGAQAYDGMRQALKEIGMEDMML